MRAYVRPLNTLLMRVYEKDARDWYEQEAAPDMVTEKLEDIMLEAQLLDELRGQPRRRAGATGKYVFASAKRRREQS